MSENRERLEKIASEFGNGAHVTVPKEWEGHILYIEKVCPFIPNVFSDVEEEREVVMDIDTGETVSGEVIEFNVSIDRDNKGMSLDMKIDTGHDFYRVEGERNVGDDSWSSEFDVSKGVSGDEARGSDEVITLTEGEMWRPVGTLESLAVKQKMEV